MFRRSRAAEPASWGFERIEAEIDAALVFAAAANEASDASFRQACLEDSEDCRAQAIAACSRGQLSAAQREQLEAKLQLLHVPAA